MCIRDRVTWGGTTSRAYFPQEGAGLFANRELSILDWIKQYTDNQDINLSLIHISRVSAWKWLLPPTSTPSTLSGMSPAFSPAASAAEPGATFSMRVG